MRIDLRDDQRRVIGSIEADPAQRPTRVAVPGAGRDVFLTWEGAVDDGGHLRRCVACGCGDLFREKAFPQITGLVVVLAFAGAVIGALGFVTMPVLIVMIAILLFDAAILVFSRSRLVCYQCRSSYHHLSIARYHRSWDRAMAERHPPAPPAPRDVQATTESPLPSSGRESLA